MEIRRLSKLGVQVGFDDAAYFLGWLAYHRGNITEALNKFEVAIALLPRDNSQFIDDEHLDYAYFALHQAKRNLRTLLPEDALARVQNSKILASRSDV